MPYRVPPEHLLDATDTIIWNAAQTSLNNAEPQLKVLHSVSQMLPTSVQRWLWNDNFHTRQIFARTHTHTQHTHTHTHTQQYFPLATWTTAASITQILESCISPFSNRSSKDPFHQPQETSGPIHITRTVKFQYRASHIFFTAFKKQFPHSQSRSRHGTVTEQTHLHSPKCKECFSSCQRTVSVSTVGIDLEAATNCPWEKRTIITRLTQAAAVVRGLLTHEHKLYHLAFSESNVPHQ